MVLLCFYLFVIFISKLNIFFSLLVSTINPSSSLSCQLHQLISVPPLCCSLFRHAASSSGGSGCCSEESSSFRSSPALSRQLFIIQPETQARSPAAPRRTFHRQVKTCQNELRLLKLSACNTIFRKKNIHLLLLTHLQLRVYGR